MFGVAQVSFEGVVVGVDYFLICARLRRCPARRAARPRRMCTAHGRRPPPPGSCTGSQGRQRGVSPHRRCRSPAARAAPRSLRGVEPTCPHCRCISTPRRRVMRTNAPRRQLRFGLWVLVVLPSARTACFGDTGAYSTLAYAEALSLPCRRTFSQPPPTSPTRWMCAVSPPAPVLAMCGWLLCPRRLRARTPAGWLVSATALWGI